MASKCSGKLTSSLSPPNSLSQQLAQKTDSVARPSLIAPRAHESRLSTFAGGRNMITSPEELAEGLTLLDPLTLFNESSFPPTLAAPNIPTLHLGAVQKIIKAACC